MITLAIDTSHHVTVGVAIDGAPAARVVVEDQRAHVEQLQPSIEAACAQAGVRLRDVDEFVVGMGPGPFTGLRVGIATAATLAEVAGKPLHRVCSLDVVALGLAGRGMGGEFVVASDARRKELNWARYAADGTRIGEPNVSAPTGLPALPVRGAVPEVYRELLDFAGEHALDPGFLAAHHTRLPVAGEEPYYLRDPDATVPGAPKSALPRMRVRR
ncbi:MAG: tRNA (adenosine(37)-N6)-threonylcarbamoyltransferase complex dimerization subunit type 1 TsaB [Propionibacterium sp.]|nr:tRNA (adenosine(37)-N6)-threonylcarbamoyltransferase complex dimerization subunit type 1 TsaB [Propionibacterium sp.]